MHINDNEVVVKMDELLSVDETADWLAISKPTIWRMIRRGEIPVVKIGQRTIRIKMSDIEDYIQAHHGKITDLR